MAMNLSDIIDRFAPEPKDPISIFCPVCDMECQTIYKDMNGEVVGCDNCVAVLDAYEYAEEIEE